MTDPLGPDIRALRKSRGMTLQELAARLDRSLGWLSQVERGQTVPSIPDLGKIAEVFGVTISFFFRTGAAQERGLIQRGADRVALGGLEMGLREELVSPTLGGSFEMIQSTFAPGAKGNGRQGPDREDGGVVLAGSLEVTLGGVTHLLQAGDSFQFKGQAYGWRNPGEVPAVVLWVIAPPIY